jgi:hypothetical protein
LRQHREQASGFRDDTHELAAGNRAPDANDQVESTDRRSSVAQYGAKHPSDAVAIDCARQRLGADHVADPATGARGRRRDKLEKFAFAAPAASIHRFERACAREPAAASSPGHRRSVSANQGTSRARPFARRAESTLRPPTVFIRARKPCVRLRLTTEGWNVRFMIEESEGEKALH